MMNEALPPPPSPPTMTQLLTQFFNVLADPKVAREGIAAAVLELEGHKHAVSRHELRVTQCEQREAEVTNREKSVTAREADLERRENLLAAELVRIAPIQAKIDRYLKWWADFPQDIKDWLKAEKSSAQV